MISIIEFIDADDSSMSAFLKGGIIGQGKREIAISDQNKKRLTGAITAGAGALGGMLIGKKILKNKEKDS